MGGSRYQNWINEWRDLSQRDNYIMDQLEYGNCYRKYSPERVAELKAEHYEVLARMDELRAMMREADRAAG